MFNSLKYANLIQEVLHLMLFNVLSTVVFWPCNFLLKRNTLLYMYNLINRKWFNELAWWNYFYSGIHSRDESTCFYLIYRSLKLKINSLNSTVSLIHFTGGFRGGRGEGGTRPPPFLKFSKIRVLGDIYTCA